MKITIFDSAMSKYFHNINEGLSPQDPSYRDDYDFDEDYERYLAALEDKEEQERGN